jgi:hypothetical protein
MVHSSAKMLDVNRLADAIHCCSLPWVCAAATAAAAAVGAAIRNAMAMTAFTIACGSLAPAIAAMSEGYVTERGVVALVDYPGALILLPTMFWGLSFGERIP